MKKLNIPHKEVLMDNKNDRSIVEKYKWAKSVPQIVCEIGGEIRETHIGLLPEPQLLALWEKYKET
jgi:hypothetical protein